ncbi:MAG: PH domain-containing protein [Bacteroidota bacterium]
MQSSKNPVTAPTRQSMIALVFIISTFLRRIVLRAWPFLIIALKPNSEGRYIGLLVILGGIALISLAAGLVNYFRFRFWLTDDNLNVEQGLVRKSVVSIPFDRIQSINTEQNLLFRVFDIVRIEVDTAGSKGSEVTIHAIDKELASQLHDFVMENKKAVKETADNEDEVPESDVSWRTILHLDLCQLVKTGLAQNHLRAILVIGAFLLARIQDVSELMGDKVIDRIDELSNSDWFSDMLAVSVLVVFGILVSVLVSLITVITRFYNFRLSESVKGMKTESGLFTRRQQNISFKRTQIFQYTAGPVRKLLGIYNVKVFQAAADPSSKGAVQIPGCPDDQVAEIKSRFFEGRTPVTELPYRISRVYVFRRWLLGGLLRGSLAAIVCICLKEWYLLPLIGAYMLYDLVKHALFYHYYRFGFSDDLLTIRSGFWILKYRTVQWYKIQSVEVAQGIYQRQKEYADLVFYTAGGSVTIPFIELGKARLLQNYVLYKVESSGEKWM